MSNVLQTGPHAALGMGAMVTSVGKEAEGQPLMSRSVSWQRAVETSDQPLDFPSGTQPSSTLSRWVLPSSASAMGAVGSSVWPSISAAVTPWPQLRGLLTSIS